MAGPGTSLLQGFGMMDSVLGRAQGRKQNLLERLQEQEKQQKEQEALFKDAERQMTTIEKTTEAKRPIEWPTMSPQEKVLHVAGQKDRLANQEQHIENKAKLQELERIEGNIAFYEGLNAEMGDPTIESSAFIERVAGNARFQGTPQEMLRNEPAREAARLAEAVGSGVTPTDKLLADNQRRLTEGQITPQTFALGGDEAGKGAVPILRTGRDNFQSLGRGTGRRITVGPDGGIVFEEGPTDFLGTATKSKAEQVQLNAETVIFNGLKLMEQLRPQDVGFKGNLIELANKFLPQVGFPAFDIKTSEVRSFLRGYRIEATRTINLNPDRFSDTDRQRVEAALPSTGIMESLDTAVASIEAVNLLFETRMRGITRRIGGKSIVELTPDEIWNKHLSGEFNEEEAFLLLSVFHGIK